MGKPKKVVADSSSTKPVASVVEEYYSLILWFLPKRLLMA